MDRVDGSGRARRAETPAHTCEVTGCGKPAYVALQGHWMCNKHFDKRLETIMFCEAGGLTRVAHAPWPHQSGRHG